MEGDQIQPIKTDQKDKMYQQLKTMGFSQEKIKQSLLICKDKEEAINFILNDVPPTQQHQDNQAQNQDQFQDCDEEDYKMIFVVRMDLKLSLAKMAELVATGALRAYRQIETQVEIDQLKEMAFYQWNEGGQRKIVVKSPGEKELLQLVQKIKKQNLNYVLVHEFPSKLKVELNEKPKKIKKMAETQQPKPEEVQVAQKQILVLGVFGPASESDIDPLTKHFKLL